MRILLFLLMQVAVIVVVGIVSTILMSIFGIRVSSGSYTSILAMCAIFGFVGSFVSLFMSKWMCKKSYGVEVIETPRNRQEQFLVNTVADLAQRAGLNMPEVGIYVSNEPNAFATGASKNSALVAVSTGLLESMSEDEVRGVLGHEVCHIANGDMVTMTLLQGVLNTFVYFFSYIVAMAVSSFLSRSSDDEETPANSGFVFHIANFVLQIVFGIIANIILMWFSRYREYRADEGSARLDGNKQNMIKALEALQRGVQPVSQEGQFSAFCINGASNLSELFMSHPPLEKRIAALRNLQLV